MEPYGQVAANGSAGSVFETDCSHAAAALRVHLDARAPTFSNLAKQPSWRRAQLAFLFDWYLNRHRSVGPAKFRSFFGSSGAEAVSTAIKLARRGRGRRAPSCFILDPTGVLQRLFNPFRNGGEALIPELHFCESATAAGSLIAAAGGCLFLARLVPGQDPGAVADLVAASRRRSMLAALDNSVLTVGAETDPFVGIEADIFLFGETVTRRQAPFGALVAKRSVLRPWTRPRGMWDHMSTYGGNDFVVGLAVEHLTATLNLGAAQRATLDQIRSHPDQAFRAKVRWLNPAIARWGRALGIDGAIERAEGHQLYFQSGRRVLDLVGASGCNIRGHCPPDLALALSAWDSRRDYWREFSASVSSATGRTAVLPAVSGATANEIALTLALSAARPRRRVIAFRETFAGRTLVAQALATLNTRQRRWYGPLYDAVTELDPAAPDVVPRFQAALAGGDIGVVWLQLLMYGAKKRLPPALIAAIGQERARRGFLIVVDEVKTGLGRTGAMLASDALPEKPDLVTISKGLSDMSFPVAAVLTDQPLLAAVERHDPGLVPFLSNYYRNPLGAFVAANVLRWAVASDLPGHVGRVSEYLWSRLQQLCAAYPNVLGSVEGAGLSVWFQFVSRGFMNGLAVSQRLLREHDIWMDSYEMTFPLDVVDEEVDRVLSALEAVLRSPKPLPWATRVRLAWAVIRGELFD